MLALAALPAAADPAQEAAAAQIARLSQVALHSGPPFPAAETLITPVQQIVLAGCQLTGLVYYRALGPDVPQLRLSADLTTTSLEWWVEEIGPVIQGTPAAIFAKLDLRAAPGRAIRTESRDVEVIGRAYILGPPAEHEPELRAALAAFAAQRAVEEQVPQAALAWMEPDRARIEPLRQALADYVSRWCRPAS